MSVGRLVTQTLDIPPGEPTGILGLVCKFKGIQGNNSNKDSAIRRPGTQEETVSLCIHPPDLRIGTGPLESVMGNDV